MSNPRAKIGDCAGIKKLNFFCPGCNEVHSVPVTGPKAWEWNNSLDRPTLRPSVHVGGHDFLIDGKRVSCFRYDGPITPDLVKIDSVCHSYVTDGRIEFLAHDTTHPLAGQAVDLPEWEARHNTWVS